MPEIIGKQQPWHGRPGAHIELRRAMVRAIRGMLLIKFPDDSDRPRMVRISKALEIRLYYNAETMEKYNEMQILMDQSIDEYIDEMKTRERLRLIVRDVFRRSWQGLPDTPNGEPIPEPLPSVINNQEDDSA